MTYFYGNSQGLNADVERHRAEEKYLVDKIAELEAAPKDKFTETYLRTYRHSLCQLQQSKADVVSKIGRK